MSLLAKIARRMRRIGLLPPFIEMRRARQFAARVRPSVSKPEAQPAHGRLASYFESHTQGPGIWKWRHYFDIYERHLSKFVGTDSVVAEVGIYSGGSLEMWRDYFGPRVNIVGVDIEDACRVYESQNTSIMIGDQADRQFWRNFREQVPRLDAIIDDGGHTFEQQCATLEEILNHLRPGGVYICEDVVGVNNQFASYARALVDELNHFDMIQSGPLASRPSPFQSSVLSMHFYPFVVVIEKLMRPVEQFIAPKHGTHWQPFL